MKYIKLYKQVFFLNNLSFLINLGIKTKFSVIVSWVQSQVMSYQILDTMVLDTYLLKTQQYKVTIKDKVEQSWERTNPLPYTSVL